MRFSFFLTVLSVLFLMGGASAVPKITTPYSVSVATDQGSDFEVLFEIEADDNGTYSIELTSREEFSFDNLRIEKTMKAGDSRTYIFKGENAVSLEDGEYRITWKAYKGDQEFNSGSFDIAVGKQASGLGLIVGAISIGTVAFLRRRET